MLNVTWERKDLSFNNQGFLSNPSMVIVALDRERLWDKVRLCKPRHDKSDKGQTRQTGRTDSQMRLMCKVF